MQSVSAATVNAGADMGVIFDTDVDRGGAVDSHGNEINRNRLVAIAAEIALEGNKGVKILATGHHVGLRDGAAIAMKGETSPEDLDPRSVHAYITGKFAEYFGFKITHQVQPDFGRLELQLSF